MGESEPDHHHEHGHGFRGPLDDASLEREDVQESRKLARAATVSVYSNTALVIAKLVVGLSTGALSVVGEALHSASDLLASLIALAAVRISSRPADKDHPYGHGKYEHVSAGIEGFILLVAAGWIVYEAVHRMLYHDVVEIFAAPGMAVMLAGVIVNIAVSQFLIVLSRKHRRRRWKRTGSTCGRTCGPAGRCWWGWGSSTSGRRPGWTACWRCWWRRWWPTRARGSCTAR